MRREKDSSIVIHPGIAVVSHMIKGKEKFEILLVRSKMGMFLSDDMDPIHAFFVIVASPDKKNLYMHTLMWIIQMAEDPKFEKAWISAKNEDDLRDIFISSWKKKRDF